ncbi:MAG: hypothetical protein K8T10_09645 [Candidatus Eremiobacteraeota bacterium]|nr:hypothetical protein [Candidatus Eremiobacteraeota bacterium]
MDHSYEEMRRAAVDILAGREENLFGLEFWLSSRSLRKCIAIVMKRRDGEEITWNDKDEIGLSQTDSSVFLEVFWDLIRQGIINVNYSWDENPPYIKVSSFSERIFNDDRLYFFHNVLSYEKIIKEQIPNIDDVTLIYLMEGMRSFLAGCWLSATVMMGVSAEHVFSKLLESVKNNVKYKDMFKNVFEEEKILKKINKFKNILRQNEKNLPLERETKEGLETNLFGIIELIRNFRNESGHPTGKIISREQCYVLLNLFIPYCKKMYQLIEFFS